MPTWQLIALIAGGIGLVLGIYLARRSHQSDPLQSGIAHVFHYLAAAAVGTVPFGIITGIIVGSLRSGVLVAIVSLATAMVLTILYAIAESLSSRRSAGVPRLAWDRWVTVSQPIGDFNARLLMGLFYFTLLLPFGLLSRLFSDRLRLKTPPDDAPLWIPRDEAVDLTLDEARRQF